MTINKMRLMFKDSLKHDWKFSNYKLASFFDVKNCQLLYSLQKYLYLGIYNTS